MSHPICERCHKEIQPGQVVEVISLVDGQNGQPRVFTEGELLLVHARPSDCSALIESDND